MPRDIRSQDRRQEEEASPSESKVFFDFSVFQKDTEWGTPFGDRRWPAGGSGTCNTCPAISYYTRTYEVRPYEHLVLIG